MPDPQRLLDALSEIYKPPSHLVTNEVGMSFTTSISPSEMATDDKPEGWEERHERWEIDNFLGMYEHEKRQITIFNKAIDFIATQMKVNRKQLEYVVRLHEWSHATFHVGTTEQMSYTLARANVEDGQQTIDDHLATLTGAYQSVDIYVHEQFAQALTYLTLGRLFREAKLDEAKSACKSLQELFLDLMKRQPHRYRLEKGLLDLDQQVLHRRMGTIVPLLRAGKIQGDRETWDKIISW